MKDYLPLWAIGISIILAFFVIRIDLNTEFEVIDRAIELQTKETKVEQLEKQIQEVLDDKEKSEQEKLEQIEELERALQAQAEQETKLAVPHTTQAQSVAPAGSCEAEIAKYDWNQDWALSVLYKESGGRPGAHNFSHITKDDSWGCFQVNLYPPNNLYRPPAEWLVVASNNVSLAYEWYVRDGRTFCGQWPNTC